jgi:putative ubiquitin-RnfH superfamily antitoxin RatB of RatAB toxin-antitoxin module
MRGQASWALNCRLPAVLVMVALTLVPAPAPAEEPIGIRQILDEPTVYHLRRVTLVGTVRDVQPLDPYTLPNGTNCYGAYLFRLEDDTSSLSVAVLGLCGKPVIRDPDVEDGDRVEVSATIQAPSHGGYYLSFRGLKVVTEQEGVVQAVVDRILPIIE